MSPNCWKLRKDSMNVKIYWRIGESRTFSWENDVIFFLDGMCIVISKGTVEVIVIKTLQKINVQEGFLSQACLIPTQLSNF